MTDIWLRILGGFSGAFVLAAVWLTWHLVRRGISREHVSALAELLETFTNDTRPSKGA